MRILAIERELPNAPAVTMEQILRVEAACVWDLQQRGIIRDIWFTAAGNHAVIMLECASATEARQHLAMLPLVHAGVIDFTVHELRSYDGFERLFAHRLSQDVDATRGARARTSSGSRTAGTLTARKEDPARRSGGGGRTRNHSHTVLIKS